VDTAWRGWRREKFPVPAGKGGQRFIQHLGDCVKEIMNKTKTHVLPSAAETILWIYEPQFILLFY
jgi:hypothetical protein